MKRVLVVGGTFDKNLGKASSLVEKIEECIEDYNDSKYLGDNNRLFIRCINGGNIETLKNALNICVDFDIVFWFANVSNDEEKIRNVKEINPKCILINSKRNDNNKYTFSELIQRSLNQKANLTIEFKKDIDGLFNMMIFDPLGVKYYDGKDIKEMSLVLLNRAMKLTDFTRKPTYEALLKEENAPTEFFKFARNCSDIFHNLVNPDPKCKRFLGNMSFRCQNGFPSFRGTDNIIYVSKRNVDKREIDFNSFVPCYLDNMYNTYYFGENKPSVDTPVQLLLYNFMQDINFMIHAHCYVDVPFIENAFTCNNVPCGAIEEVSEIINAISDLPDQDLYAVNLLGHGCIIMSRNLESILKLQDYKDNCFYSREMPEDIDKTLEEFKKREG